MTHRHVPGAGIPYLRSRGNNNITRMSKEAANKFHCNDSAAIYISFKHISWMRAFMTCLAQVNEIVTAYTLDACIKDFALSFYPSYMTMLSMTHLTNGLFGKCLNM